MLNLQTDPPTGTARHASNKAGEPSCESYVGEWKVCADFQNHIEMVLFCQETKGFWMMGPLI